ncbi:hypothetical protein JCM10207_007391 [Rhodosporidiobolus poonsookiae]
MDTVDLHLPDSEQPHFKPESVRYGALMGQWFVVASTLPLWKGKKNVSITYTALPGEPETTFGDLVQYRSSSAAPDSAPSTVRGVDRLQTDLEGNGVRWKWRGSGWLKIASSHWQILGSSLLPTSSPLADSPASTLPEFAITYFSSTLFTPAGLDIYTRSPDGLSDAQVDVLIKKLEALGGEVEKLVKDGGMFRIPHGQ